MTPVDYCAWFDARPAEVAILSTFNFDPVFFECRLLQRSKALVNARRVLVLMDAGQFRLLLAERRPARWLNRRYLVVPIEKPGGVFHPKLHLLLGPTGADVICGSNNLTAPGCMGNLELVNRVTVSVEDGQPAPATAHVARKAYRFFERCLNYGMSDARQLAEQWLCELKKEFTWLEKGEGEETAEVDLVHTLDGGDWPVVGALAPGGSPARLVIVSPFYDPDLAMLQRVRAQWPMCQVEIHAQSGQSNLPAEKLTDVCPDARLFDLRCDNRRLHAKLFAWEAGESVECLVGSANFTTAAWDRRNVEACLRLRSAGRQIHNLFSNGVQRCEINPSDFSPGREKPPDPEPAEADDRPRVTSAHLNGEGVLRVRYVNPLHPATTVLLVELRDWQGKEPLRVERIASHPEGVATLVVKPESLAGCHGALTVFLTALVGQERRAGIPCWVIQEGCLTRQPAGGAVRDLLQRQIAETGQGLTTRVDELLREAKIDEVIEYLRRLQIHFDGGIAQRTCRAFGRSAHDPFRPDVPPDWTRISDEQRQDLRAAVQEFADRHERSCLCRHGRQGNLDGMRNLLDVFVTVCGLLWHYYKLQLFPEPWQGPQVISRVLRYVDLATAGYLANLMANRKGDPERVQHACAEWNFAGHMRAALLIAQRVRWEAPEAQGTPLLRWFEADVKTLESRLSSIRARRVSAAEIKVAFDRYEITDAEREEWRQIALRHQPERISQAKLWRVPEDNKKAVRKK